MSMVKNIFFLLLLVLSNSVDAQRTSAHLPGQVIVSLQPGANPDALLNRICTSQDRVRKMADIEEISADLNLWLLKFNPDRYDENELLLSLRNFSGVKLAQFNHIVEDRLLPNDPQYDKQWQWSNNGSGGGLAGADTKAELAWNFSTGGISTQGDTIVVAVIDSGIDLNHEDLKDNIWYNIHEIPGNGIDDDGNGYADDYRGWNVQEKNDNTQSSLSNDHGVMVSGVIGAKGNNSKGVTGVNWNVKIMTVRANSSSWLLDNSEVNVISAYAYILKMRKLYNQTNGQKGAFVVATNASWGADEAKPEDSPIWCNFYDTLGYYGILNCGATTNNNINVDVRGDLPTTCPSDYLIAVQASNNTDINVSSGYGKINIDIAAPGTGILTTGVGSTYKNGTGTSFAAPMVTGTIGLMYSVPGKLIDLSKNYPSEAALLLKKAILGGADVITALQNQNATGGRLNIFRAIKNLNNLASKCTPPVNVKVDSISDNSIRVNYDVLPEITKVNIYYKVLSSTNWMKVENISAPFSISNLQKCSSYQYFLEYFCSTDSVKSDISNFQTKGCCEIPILSSNRSDTSSISLNWTAVVGIQRYELRFLNKGKWDTIPVYTNGLRLNNLLPCTEYEMQVRAVCDTIFPQNFVFSSTLRVKTTGCGACVDNSYCIPKAIANFEWIRTVKVNTLTNTTAGSTEGYKDYPSKTTSLSRGNEYDVSFAPAYSFSPTNVYFRVWIDYNQDGILDNETELVFDKKRTVSDTIESGKISIPWSAKVGLTRMRVGMKAILANDSIAPFSPCEKGLVNSFFGEFEDYCVTIEPGFVPCPVLENPRFQLSSGSILVKWDTLSGALGYEVYYKKKNLSDWNKSVVLNPFFTLSAGDCEDYELRFKTICENDQSDFSRIFAVKSNCTAAADLSNNELIEIFPNPFSDHIFIKLLSTSEKNFEIELLNFIGQSLAHTEGNSSAIGIVHQWKPELELAPGVYFLKLRLGQKITIYKMLKI